MQSWLQIALLQTNSWKIAIQDKHYLWYIIIYGKRKSEKMLRICHFQWQFEPVQSISKFSSFLREALLATCGDEDKNDNNNGTNNKNDDNQFISSWCHITTYSKY